MLDHSLTIKERTAWESAQYKLRIVEIRMSITLEFLIFQIEKYQDGRWQRVESRRTLSEALSYVEYHFGICTGEE